MKNLDPGLDPDNRHDILRQIQSRIPARIPEPDLCGPGAQSVRISITGIKTVPCSGTPSILHKHRRHQKGQNRKHRQESEPGGARILQVPLKEVCGHPGTGQGREEQCRRRQSP